MAFRQLVDAVPFYAGLTLEEIGGRGVRWPGAAAAAALTPPERRRRRGHRGPRALRPPRRSPGRDGLACASARYRPIWAAPEVEISPALHYTIAHQQLELSPEDARRLGIAHGDDGRTSPRTGRGCTATRARRAAASRPGTAFLAEGIATDSANALTEPPIEVIKR